MKYLRTKHSRRRGVAIELAMMLLLVMTAMSIMLVSTTMIQINKQKESTSDLTEIVDEIKKMEYDNVGKYFKQLVYIELNEENNEPTELQFSHINIDNIKTLISSKYGSLFTYRNLSFEVTLTRSEAVLGEAESETTTKDVTRVEKEKNGPFVTYLNAYTPEEEEEASSQDSALYIKQSGEIINTVSVTLKATRTIENKYTETLSLTIFDSNDNSNLYELTISRDIVEKVITDDIIEYSYEETVSSYKVSDIKNENVIDEKTTTTEEPTDIENLITNSKTTVTYKYLISIDDYSITNVEIK